LAASILIEPVDWVMTGIEVFGNIREGDWGSAAVNTALAMAPFVGGWADDALSRGVRFAPDEPPGGGGLINNIGSQSTDVIQTTWRESVSYVQRFDLPSNGVVPGARHSSIVTENGVAFIDGTRV